MPASKKACKKIRNKALKKKVSMQHDEGIKYIYLNRRLYSFLPQNKREIPEGDALITEGDTKFKANDFEVREIAQKMRTPA